MNISDLTMSHMDVRLRSQHPTVVGAYNHPGTKVGIYSSGVGMYSSGGIQPPGYKGRDIQ